MLFCYCAKLLFVLLLWDSFNLGKTWDYQNFNDWGDVSATCNTGQNQSPINLRTDVIGQNHGRRALEFLNYNQPATEMEITNNGHTVELSGMWQGNNTPSVTGAIFSREVYNFSNAHLHWSTDNNNGTEHAIEGRKYAAELHLVHVNRKYESVEEAAGQPDGIAVVAILFEVNDNVPPNPGMQQFAQLAQEVLLPNSTRTVTSLNLSSFIPNPLPPVYSYIGSLTTPPCTENVRWAVLSRPQPITSAIIRAFRNVILDNGDTHNIRPLQPINNRLIEFYSH